MHGARVPHGPFDLRRLFPFNRALSLAAGEKDRDAEKKQTGRGGGYQRLKNSFAFLLSFS